MVFIYINILKLKNCLNFIIKFILYIFIKYLYEMIFFWLQLKIKL